MPGPITMLDEPTGETAVDLNERPQGRIVHHRPDEGQLRPVGPATPSTLLEMAVSRGADIDTLERLMRLRIEHDAHEAKKAMVDAMAAFKAEPMTIAKRKEVGYTTKEGDFVGYKHAELSDVTAVVVPAMGKHGLSHRWNIEQSPGRVVVSCIITHKAGHSETVTMEAAPDNSGKKNAIQQVASTVSYLQRYTLLAATGMATTGDDDDGQASGDAGAARDAVIIGVLDSLLGDLKATTTDAAAAALWASGSKTLHATGSEKAYAEFKQAVVDHRKALKTREAAAC